MNRRLPQIRCFSTHFGCENDANNDRIYDENGMFSDAFWGAFLMLFDMKYWDFGMFSPTNNGAFGLPWPRNNSFSAIKNNDNRSQIMNENNELSEQILVFSQWKIMIKWDEFSTNK